MCFTPATVWCHLVVLLRHTHQYIINLRKNDAHHHVPTTQLPRFTFCTWQSSCPVHLGHDWL